MSATLIVFAVIVSAIWLYRRKSAYRLPPGPKGLPLLGVGLELDMLTAHRVLPKWAEKFGSMYTFTVMGVHTVVINDAKLARKAFLDEEFKSLFNDRPPTFVGKYIFYGYKDIGFSMYTEVCHLRKVFHKALHFYGDGVPRFESLITQELQRLMEELKTFAGTEVDPRPIVQASFCMLMSILLTGEHNDTQVSEVKRLMFRAINAVNKIVEPVYDTVLQAAPFLRFLPGPYRRLYMETVDSCKEVIGKFYYQQKETFRSDMKRGFVDHLLDLQETSARSESEVRLTEENVKGIILDTLVAGVNTSTNTFLWMLQSLLHHPECVSRIRSELDAVVGRDRCPQFTDRPSMPYTEAVILETLRYSSLLPFLLPHMSSGDAQFEGYSFPKGTQIMINTVTIHHDEKVWDDPWSFRPERFLDTVGQLVVPSHPARQSLIGFGVGKRQCPGQSMAMSRVFLYLTTLLQTFDIETTELRPFDPRTDAGGGGILEAPPFSCRFVPRQY